MKGVRSSYRCSVCCDTGWIPKRRKDGSRYVIPCACREKEKIKRRWKSLGINIEFSDLTFKNFKVWNESSKKLKETAIAYFNDFHSIKNSRKNSILLCGQPGSGKTHIAAALAVNFINDGVKAEYMPYRDCITKLKQRIRDDEYYRKETEKYQKCEMLLIDDLFKGRVTGSDINIIFEIINYRYINHLPIIVSTEFLPEEILGFDEACGSRIIEMCRSFIAAIPRDRSNNYRLKP